jgi:AraC-like DNA-binding protein
MVTEVCSLRYLVERRIEGAKILRSQTDLSVAQIATRVGFATPSHFTSVFRKHLKTTPNTPIGDRFKPQGVHLRSPRSKKFPQD